MKLVRQDSEHIIYSFTITHIPHLNKARTCNQPCGTRRKEVNIVLYPQGGGQKNGAHPEEVLTENGIWVCAAFKILIHALLTFP